MTQQNPVPRWGMTFQNGELELWVRLGRFSVWVDTASNRFELNGHSLFGWVGRRDPLDSLRGLPLDLEANSDPRLKAFLGAQVRPPLLSGKRGGLALAVGGWLALSASHGGMDLATWAMGCGWVLLGAGLRGVAGLVHGAMSLLLLGLTGVSPWLIALSGFLLLMAQGMRLRRGVAPLLAVWSLNPGGPPMLTGWLLCGLGVGAWALRSQRLSLGLTGEETWRYHCQIQTVLGIDDATLWSLHPDDATGLPPEPAAHASSRWRVDGKTPVVGLGDETQQWILLPKVILVVRAGITARIFPWSELRMEGRPCTWEARPPGLPEEAWMLHLRLGEHALALLFGEGKVGRAFQKQWATWAPSQPQVMAARVECEGPARAALALLGLLPGSTWAQIRSAFRREVRRCHPDHHPRANDAERRALEARMQALNESMEVLEANFGQP